jgi:hypothetical protein
MGGGIDAVRRESQSPIRESPHTIEDQRSQII